MKKLYLSRSDRKIAGLCGGLGHYFRIDPNVLRVLFIFFMILTAVFPFVLIYLVGWVLIPKEPDVTIVDDYEKFYRTPYDKKLAGICGGVGKYLSVDSTMIRLLVVIATIFTGFFPLMFTYAAAWWLFPEEASDLIQ